MAAHIEALLPPVMEVSVEMWHLPCPGPIFSHFRKLLLSCVSSSVLNPLIRLGAGPRLASAVGKDEQGRGLLRGQQLDTSLVRNYIVV